LVDWIAWVLEMPLVIADELTPLDAIVVLGAPLAPGNQLGPVLIERCRAAITLYHQGGAPLIVVTGGVTGRSTRAEATVMAEALIGHGVSASAVVVEERSRSTAENAAFVAEMLTGRRRIWIVTQPYHGRRARWLFRRAGFEPRVWHIVDSIQYRDRSRALRWLSREYGSWVRALMRRSRVD